jgi:hypothetical protein
MLSGKFGRVTPDPYERTTHHGPSYGLGFRTTTAFSNSAGPVSKLTTFSDFQSAALGLGLDVVAPFTVGLLLEARLDALGQRRGARLLDRLDGVGDLTVETGLAQDALG